MNERMNHFYLDVVPQFSAEIWKVLTEHFEMEMTRMCHSMDGEEQNVWLKITGVKTEE